MSGGIVAGCCVVGLMSERVGKWEKLCAVPVYAELFGFSRVVIRRYKGLVICDYLSMGS